MPSTVELFYHGCRGIDCGRWSKGSHYEDDEKALEESIAEESIVHRQHREDYEWTTHSFTVQDPFMRKHLLSALEDYQDLDLQKWTFEPPYEPLIHRWSRISHIPESGPDPAESEAITYLVEFLRPVLAPILDSVAQTEETGLVTFDRIWHIFPPDAIVLTTFYGVETACRVTQCEQVDDERDPYWKITMEYVDWNGEYCGYDSTSATIYYFEKTRRVTSLPVYPISFHADGKEITDRFVKRGRKFESLRGYHFQTCVGSKILRENASRAERAVSGRVIIDTYAYYHSNSLVKPKLAPLEGQANRTKTERQDSWHEDEGPDLIVLDPMVKAGARVEELVELTDEQCLIAMPWLTGMDLKTKQWALFRVDQLEPVRWNDAAFDSLILPGNEKTLAWEFVESKGLENNSFDDFIEDKGRGIIILMFGPPGVGKTFTAEAVAERARVPLYAMSAGTLGTSPEQVEASLDRALGLCEMWNAMLLLDEADVFLGARTDTDLARNELVSVFLTKLEYSTGICFLTTNRMTTIDPAFQSRIDLHLPYRDLTPAARRQVWENFMEHTGRERFDISDADLDQLSHVKMNGREIKSMIKSANLLSLKGNRKIDMRSLSMLVENRAVAVAAFRGA